MLLVCDIGNSRIKAGIFKKQILSGFKVFEDVDSVIKYGIEKKIENAAVCSVVPSSLNEFEKKFNKNFKFQPVVITRSSNFNLLLDYKTPATLGIDRLCSAEGAIYLFKKDPLRNFNKNVFIITIDFGTATTVNIVKGNTFTGGLIIPGINIMFDSLANETAQLPDTKIADYKGVIGCSTKSSIASGIINSTIGAISNTINYIQQENKGSAIYLYITGGNAKELLPFLNFNYKFEKALVLYGIKSVYENRVNRKQV